MGEKASEGVLRILAIGNSFSEDSVEQNLWELFDSVGTKVIIGNLYIGGCTLKRHCGNSVSGEKAYAYRKVVDGVMTNHPGWSLLQGIKDEEWDVVTVQQASGVSGLYESYKPYLHDLIEYVNKNVRKPVKICFHETWAYSTTSKHEEYPNYQCNQMAMYNAIVDAVQHAVQDNPEIVGVIPSGTAIQNGRTASKLGDSFNRDGFHLEKTFGRFTAAATWFEALSGLSVMQNPWHPETITSEIASICKTAAHAACSHPYEVTKLSE